MVLFCHNTDLGDGWERGSESDYYDLEFSRKRAFPMGVNIVVHAVSDKTGASGEAVDGEVRRPPGR